MTPPAEYLESSRMKTFHEAPDDSGTALDHLITGGGSASGDQVAACDSIIPAADPIRLFKGDYRDVLRSLPPGSVDLVCTSPNYNVGRQYGSNVDGDRLPTGEYQAALDEHILGYHDSW